MDGVILYNLIGSMVLSVVLIVKELLGFFNVNLQIPQFYLKYFSLYLEQTAWSLDAGYLFITEIILIDTIKQRIAKTYLQAHPFSLPGKYFFYIQLICHVLAFSCLNISFLEVINILLTTRCRVE